MNDWPVKKLGDLVVFSQLGLVKSKNELSETGFPYLKMDSILSDGRLDLGKSIKVKATESEIKNFTIKKNDFLFNTRNSPKLVGKSSVFNSEKRYLFNNNILRLRFSRLLPPFINAYLHTQEGKQKLNLIKKGTTSVSAIYQSNLFSLSIPVPTIQTQKKIIEKLDAIRKAQELNDIQISKTEELFETILNNLSSVKNTSYKNLFEITDLITDFVANGSFASLRENVKYIRVEDYAILIRLVDYSNKFRGPFVYINEHAYNFLSKSKLESGDLILSNVGANLGTIFRVPDLKKPISLGPNAILIRSKKYDKFLYFWLLSSIGKSAIRSIVSQTGQPKFNKTDLRNIKILIPAEKELQKIIEKLEMIQEYKKLLLKQKLLYKELFDSALDKCMKGELVN